MEETMQTEFVLVLRLQGRTLTAKRGSAASATCGERVTDHSTASLRATLPRRYCGDPALRPTMHYDRRQSDIKAMTHLPRITTTRVVCPSSTYPTIRALVWSLVVRFLRFGGATGFCLRLRRRIRLLIRYPTSHVFLASATTAAAPFIFLQPPSSLPAIIQSATLAQQAGRP
ncbi:hypothetical protein BDZ89DRAFT_1041733 [Hymenopellis radicata]|nr:hypothetical protein BDZ89DRAFT_1041733 [Hymenopellis radicata]